MALELGATIAPDLRSCEIALFGKFYDQCTNRLLKQVQQELESHHLRGC
jgi:hypothetical protein